METPCCTTLYCSRIWSSTRERPSTVDHVIFRDDFKPVDDWLLFKNVLVVRNAQADSDSIFGESVEAICRHRDTSQGEIRRTLRPSPACVDELSGLGLGAVGGASALALAGVLCLAAVVSGLASALAFAGVLAFTCVLLGLRIIEARRGRESERAADAAGSIPVLEEVEAASVVVAPVNSPDMAAVINRDFMVALVIGCSFRKQVWVDGWHR
jgi:hypothetical protein